jgi:hypothetical protein
VRVCRLIIALISLEIVAHLAEKWQWWRSFRWEQLFDKPKAAADKEKAAVAAAAAHK